ncbi:hypothetical protein WJX73_002055 [Symbiochloris irregularis]|uniref:Uncharacterized protein n=1 Tax=Symbiochloris irregularis TaxID=706552 RepID=A0AAW1NIG3_9CHLO
MTTAKTLQLKVEQVEALLRSRQSEIAAKRLANDGLRATLEIGEKKEALVDSQLLGVRLTGAQLRLEDSKIKRGHQRGSKSNLAEDVTGACWRLSAQRDKHAVTQRRCQRELERLAFFRDLIQQQLRNKPSQSSIEELNEVNQKIREQRKQLAALNVPERTATLQAELAQKQHLLHASQQSFQELQQAKQVFSERLEVTSAEVNKMHGQQRALQERNIDLQQLARDCEEATVKLAKCRSARAAAQGSSNALQERIAHAKTDIFALVN